jgi:hypothetical protein
MTLRPVESWRAWLPLLVLLAFPHGLEAQQTGKPASAGTASTAAIDTLTAPIALYPDALIAQLMTAATDLAAAQKFTGWMAGNASLKGEALQAAAQKAGFSACLVALAPFPQVIQMLVDKPDWTKELGAAFKANQNAVFESIQRLRAAAKALGNLKTTPQQEVVTEKTSTGQEVIVIQPANPQVVYVPVYNTQTVYVQSAPPPSPSANAAAAAMIGFTAGVIIGASSNNYYYGPYAWRGAAMYEEAWDRREDYWEDREDFYEDRRDDYQDNRQENQSQRQSAAQSNQAQRQSASQANQAQRQSAREGAAATSSAASGQASSQKSGRSGGLGGYQSGASTRAQSSRGSASRSSSRSSGERRR